MHLEDILYEKKDGVAKITINRPGKGNALRTKTLSEIIQALEDARDDHSIGVIVLTGAGDRFFCTGRDAGDITPDKGGYSPGVKKTFEVERFIRMCQKPVIAAVNGWAGGGGHILHVLCDLTIASETARFAQVGPKVGSFEAGSGAAYLARVIGEKKAIPLRRIATPEEIGNAVLSFASPLSDYITGQVLSVSGGLTMVD